MPPFQIPPSACFLSTCLAYVVLENSKHFQGQLLFYHIQMWADRVPTWCKILLKIWQNISDCLQIGDQDFYSMLPIITQR